MLTVLTRKEETNLVGIQHRTTSNLENINYIFNLYAVMFITHTHVQINSFLAAKTYTWCTWTVLEYILIAFTLKDSSHKSSYIYSYNSCFNMLLCCLSIV